jgi:hypothetical protein
LDVFLRNAGFSLEIFGIEGGAAIWGTRRIDAVTGI